MNLIEQLEARNGAMKVAELCELLGVDDKHIYRMAARGSLPSFHVGGAVRFDPQEVAKWLRAKYGVVPVDNRRPPVSVRAAHSQQRRTA
jgi:excisionase family DNA binding protein